MTAANFNDPPGDRNDNRNVNERFLRSAASMFGSTMGGVG